MSLEQRAFEWAARLLADDHPELAPIIDQFGIPHIWLREPGFPSLVLFILEQQVSLASGAAAYTKVLRRIGTMTPDAVLASTPEELRLDGVSRQKDRYLRALSEAVVSGELDLAALETADEAEVRSALLRLPGVGPWTVDVYLLACLNRPDLWPIGDRALQVATGEALGLDTAPTGPELQAIGERWRPYRSTAARLLWHGYLCRRGRTETPTMPIMHTE